MKAISPNKPRQATAIARIREDREHSPKLLLPVVEKFVQLSSIKTNSNGRHGYRAAVFRSGLWPSLIPDPANRSGASPIR
jgi:hypothetical protein